MHSDWYFATLTSVCSYLKHEIWMLSLTLLNLLKRVVLSSSRPLRHRIRKISFSHLYLCYCASKRKLILGLFYKRREERGALISLKREFKVLNIAISTSKLVKFRVNYIFNFTLVIQVSLNCINLNLICSLNVSKLIEKLNFWIKVVNLKRKIN